MCHHALWVLFSKMFGFYIFGVFPIIPIHPASLTAVSSALCLISVLLLEDSTGLTLPCSPEHKVTLVQKTARESAREGNSTARCQPRVKWDLPLRGGGKHQEPTGG